MKLFRILFIALILLLAVGAVFADEATPEPVSVSVSVSDGVGTVLTSPNAVVTLVPDDPTANTPIIVIPPESLPSAHETVINISLGALAIALALGTPILIALFLLAWSHVPSWAQQEMLRGRGTIESAVDRGGTLLEDLARRTPGQFDDLAAGYIHEAAKAAAREVMDRLAAQARPAGPPTPGVIPPPPPITPGPPPYRKPGT